MGPHYEAVRYGETVEVRKEAYRKLLDLAEAESGWILLYQPHELYGMREDIAFAVPPNDRPYVLPLRAGQVKFDASK